jgi:uncharacterized membrane protein
MGSEQESDNAKPSMASGSLMYIMGCTLLVIAMINTGPLQWVLYAGAIGLFLYAAYNSAKAAKKKRESER